MFESLPAVDVVVPLSGVTEVVVTLLPFFEAPGFVFLDGDLGAGKTTLVSELVNFLTPGAFAVSPTFSLMSSIPLVGAVENCRFTKILHLDLYRIESAADLQFLGLELEYTPSTLCFVEWGLKFSKVEWDELFVRNGILRPSRMQILRIFRTSIAGSFQHHVDTRRYVLTNVLDT